MSLYAVVKGETVDGIAIGEAPMDADGKWICVDGMEPTPGPGWKYVNNTFVAPIEIPQIPIPNIISKVAFRFRLTDDEYVGILTAAKTDVEVAAWVETFNMVSKIDLDNQRTIDGVAKLVSKNLLTQDRANHVLTDPVQNNERP